MTIFHTIYLSSWLSLTIFALITSYVNKYEFWQKDYYNFLFQPWKLITFIIALIGITVVAPYSGDYTWDYTDSVLTSFATYLLIPWSVGVLVREYRKPNLKFFIALILFWQPCWIYDLYILIRDGSYPQTWAANLVLSGGICVYAGLLWNLHWQNGRQLFAFRIKDWPRVEPVSFNKIILPALVLILPVALLVGWFVADYLDIF